MKFSEEYKKSLKMVETEEVFDLFIFRPLGYVVMKVFYYTSATPNFLSLISLFFGLISAFFIAHTGNFFLIYGALALAIAEIFDCSDGMLARAKNNGTKFGKVFDGIIDYIVFFVVYLAIAIHLFITSTEINIPGIIKVDGEYWLWFPLLFITGFATMHHTITIDGARNDFISYCNGNETAYIKEEYERCKAGYNEIKDKKGYLTHKIMYNLYFFYMKVQMKALVKVKSGITPEIYYRKNRFLMRLFTFFGPTMHLTLIMVCAVFNVLEIYVWIVLLPVTFLIITLQLIQKASNNK